MCHRPFAHSDLLSCPCNLTRWKEERRRHFPTAANLAHREAEAAARREAGGLDPKAQERRQRLKEILERQKAMGLDRWVEGDKTFCEGEGFYGRLRARELDTEAQERRQRLKEILEKQRAMGLDRWVKGAVTGIQA